MQRLLPALLLAACTITNSRLDAGEPDAGPTPTCRPASENPDCVGACDHFEPNCPPGYAPVCGRPLTGWFRENGWCQLTRDEEILSTCDGANLPACSDGRAWVCVAQGCSTGCFNNTCDENCSIVCGATCTGWGVEGCAYRP